MPNLDLFEREPCLAAVSFPPPRAFQVTAHEALSDGLRQGHRCQQVMAPTGAGKAYLGLRICHEAVKKGKRALFVADRATLIEQVSATADSYGLVEHGIIMANHWRSNPALPLQIASVQTLAARGWPTANVIIIDESHSMYSTWTEHVLRTKAAVIGLSATPFSPGLGGIFTNLINATTMSALVDSGALVPMQIFSGTRPDMSGAATDGGEWTDSVAAERGMAIIGDVVAEWSQRAWNRKTIVFGATIAHCEELCRQFNDAGIMAAVFSGYTKPEMRRELLAEYCKPDGAIRVLISVEALAKGFDVPEVSCVCDCRPLRKSLSTAMQMWGRGVRASPETGKTDCILLDFSGNIIRFGRDFENIYYHGLASLDAGDRLDREIRRDADEKEVKACPACGFSPFARRCMSCGHEATRKSGVEHETGVMREIRVGKTQYAEDAQHLWAQVVAYARAHSTPEKQSRRAWHLFKAIAGVEAPRSFRVEGTVDVPVTRAVANKIRSLNIAHARRCYG